MDSTKTMGENKKLKGRRGEGEKGGEAPAPSAMRLVP
jgi:hypothetical protein